MAGEAEGDGHGIVGDGEADDAADGAAAEVGGLEEGADAAEVAAEEVEVGFVFEQAAIDGGGAGTLAA